MFRATAPFFGNTGLAMELSHVALDSGLHRRSTADSVSDDLVGELQAWLLDLVWSQRTDNLPARWPGYRATATDFGGGLVLTVYEAGIDKALLTIGIARRASHGSPLWRVLTALPRAMQGLNAPRTPWCGVLDHSSQALARQLESFIQACAWVWVQRPLPSRRAASRAVGLVRASSGIP